jgi:RND family efflux transporter MFP subunit
MANKQVRGWKRILSLLPDKTVLDAKRLSGHIPDMTKRKWVTAAAAVAAVLVVVLASRALWTSNGAAQNARQAGRVVPVEVATAEKKKVPVRLEALGNVTPIASVAVKARLGTTIVGVQFQDGARVKAGDLLFTLDSRQIEAQIDQAEGNLARDQAQLEQAERDVRRNTELVAKNATAQLNLDNAKTAADVSRAAIKADQAALENLKVQLSYCRITAPISGRMSAANVKVGNYVQPSEILPLATIIQVAPVYVSFSLPQRYLPDVRQALAAETATVEALVPGDARSASGQVTMIENTVDQTTGMVTVRATMPNTDELLWPGTLVTTKLTLREETAVIVPSTAVQVSQAGNFVFVVVNGVAKVQTVKVDRLLDGYSVISVGLDGNETVVTDGQLLLSEGTRVNPRGPKTGS